MQHLPPLNDYSIKEFQTKNQVEKSISPIFRSYTSLNEINPTERFLILR